MSRLQKSIISPRFWATLSALSFALFIGVMYHHAQMAAFDALASKAPKQVLIQDFVEVEHTNVMQEVHVLAVADIENAVQMKLGDDGADRLVDVVPVYPVGREAKPFADRYLRQTEGTRRRPVPRDAAAEVNTQQAFLKLIEPYPVGVLIFDALGNDPKKLSLADLATMTISDATHGKLVAIVGVQLERADVFEQIQEALGVTLVSGAIAILPFADNRVEAPIHAKDYTTIRSALLLISALTLAIALLTWISPFPSRAETPSADAGKKVQASSRFPSVSFFQPIRNQSEITEDDDSIPTPGQRISRVIKAASPFRVKSRP